MPLSGLGLVEVLARVNAKTGEVQKLNIVRFHWLFGTEVFLQVTTSLN